jgi:hypothetical protein
MRFGNTLTALTAATTAATGTPAYSGQSANGTASFAPSLSNTHLRDPVGTSGAEVPSASPSTRADNWDVSPAFQGQSDGSKNTTEHFKRYGGNSEKPGTSDGDANNAAGMVFRTVETLRAKCPSKADELSRAVVYADFLEPGKDLTALTDAAREIRSTLDEIPACPTWNQTDKINAEWDTIRYRAQFQDGQIDYER